MQRSVYGPYATWMGAVIIITKSIKTIGEMNSTKPNRQANNLVESMRMAQFNSPMLKMLEELKNSPAIKLAESMRVAQLNSPMLKMLEELKDSPAIKLAESMRVAQLNSPMLKMLEELKDSPAIKLAESMRAAQLSNPMLKMLEELKNSPAIKLMETIRAAQFNSPALNMLKGGNAFESSELENVLKSISKQEWPLAHAAFEDEIVINSNNTVTVDSSTLSCDEIQILVNTIADNVISRSSDRLEDGINRLIAEIQALRNPLHERLLSQLFYPLILALIFCLVNPIADFYIKESLGGGRREEEKKLRKHILSATDNVAQLDSYRLVTRELLEVRGEPSAKAAAIGRLHWGNIVLLIEKRKDWSLVAWSDDENGLAMQGWVFSRYLGKFR